MRSGLGGAQTPTLVANAAVDGITDVLTKLKQAAIGAQAGGDSANAEATQIQSLLTQITGYETDATVNGVNLIAGAVVNDVTTTQISAWAISGRNCCYRCSNRSPDRSLGFELFDVHLARLRDAFGVKWRKAPACTTIRGILRQLNPTSVESRPPRDRWVRAS